MNTPTESQSEQQRLDITVIKSVIQLNGIKWENFLDTTHPYWVRYIKYPVAQKDLDLICELSDNIFSMVRLNNSQGELYWRAL